MLLLISKDFIASDYIMGVELGLAMQRQQQGQTTVVPILLRPVDLQPEDAQDMPFVDLLKPQGLPRDLKPVTTWPNRDEAWTSVASGLRATVNGIRARRPAQADAAAGTRSRAAPAPQDFAVDGAIERVVVDVVQRVEQATAARGGVVSDAPTLHAQARRLIDTASPPRVLWVDDHPESNRAEAAMLARLQIEVEPVRSIAEALSRLATAASEAQPFDLVISDWSRQAEGPLAGLRLLQALRAAGHRQHVVYYHGSFGTVQRTGLAVAARAAGALGEATMPQELLGLVLQALQR